MFVLKTFLAVLTVTIPVIDSDDITPLKSGAIVAGAGYSDDTQQVAPQACYNATVGATSEQQAINQLDLSLSYSELESKLGISTKAKGGYGQFSADAKASYMRSMEDKDYSLSLNYYHYASNKVGVQLAGYGIQALTESGKTFYNDGKNPYFGVICGNYYLSDYKQGALLIMGLNIKFSSSKAKEEFSAKAGGSFGNIMSASASIKKAVNNSEITGSVLIQAFQTGGEPSQLAKILNKDGEGQYYALTCSLTAMENCVKAASGLLDYAKDEFSTQFSFKNNTGLTPLGIAFSGYTPIEYIGLTTPPSLVTQEVIQYRNELSSKLVENKYYQQKLYSLVSNAYPVKLDDAFLKKANSVLSKADSNVLILMQTHGGAADCFNFPNKCKDVKARLDSQLKNITINDLKFLEKIKYILEWHWGPLFLYNTGAESGNNWENQYPRFCDSRAADIHNLTITDKQYSYFIYCDPKNVRFDGHLNGSDTKYEGTQCIRNLRDHGSKEECKPRHLIRCTSPFFFELYSENSTAQVTKVK